MYTRKVEIDLSHSLTLMFSCVEVGEVCASEGVLQVLDEDGIW